MRVIADTDVPAETDTASESAASDTFTEELPPLHIDPRSFDARVAGIEPCSVARELAKHHSSVAAFEVEQEQARSGRAGEDPADEAELLRKR